MSSELTLRKVWTAFAFMVASFYALAMVTGLSYARIWRIWEACLVASACVLAVLSREEWTR